MATLTLPSSLLMRSGTMFWNENPGGNCTLTALLDNENLTLAELLDHEDILQECKSQNRRLVEFLENVSTIEELINLITKEPISEDDPANSYKHPAIACEIITSGLFGLVENLANTPGLLGKLFSFLDSKPPLNPLLASFFSKTFHVLLARHSGQNWYSYNVMCFHVLEYSRESATFLPKLLEHIGTSAIMDTLQCIALMDVDDMKKVTLEWLNSQNLIENLINLLCGKYDSNYNTTKLSEITAAEESSESNSNNITVTDSSEAIETPIVADIEEKKVEDAVEQPKTEIETGAKNDDVLEKRLLADRSENAAKLLCNIIMKGREPSDDCPTKVMDPLVTKCTLDSTIDFLLNSIFTSDVEVRQNAIINGTQVILSLLNDSPGPYNSPVVDLVEIQRIAEAILPYFPKFKEVILETPPIFKYGYSNGIDKPVGAARLAIIRLLEVMLRLDNRVVAAAFVENNIMTHLLDMFVEYRWNNFLHAHIESIIKQMIETTVHKDIYNIHLFVECKLLDRIVDAWELNDEAQAKREPRRGYMGHLIQIANCVQKCLMLYTSLMDDIPLSSRNRWPSFLCDKLDKVNEVQNIFLGGHHPSNINNSNHHLQNPQTFIDISGLQIQEINFEDDDDCELNKDMTSPEELFLAKCEDHDYMTEEQRSMDNWNREINLQYSDANSHYYSKEPSELEISTNNIYKLATQLRNCEDPTFNKWLSDICKLNEGVDASTSSLQSAIIGTDSPWGASSSTLPGNQDEWADFSNFSGADNNIDFASVFSSSAAGGALFSEGLDDPKLDDIVDHKLLSALNFSDTFSDMEKIISNNEFLTNSANMLDLSNQLMKGDINVNFNKVEEVASDSANQDAATIMKVTEIFNGTETETDVPNQSTSDASPSASADLTTIDDQTTTSLIDASNVLSKALEAVSLKDLSDTREEKTESKSAADAASAETSDTSTCHNEIKSCD